MRSVSPESVFYTPVREALGSGQLAPHSILGSIMQEVTSASRYEKGYILDGGMRHISDRDYFDPKPDVVIYLNITYELSKSRTLSRMTCQESGHIYNTQTHPPIKADVCDLDGSPLIIRDDDNEELLKQRWEIFNRDTLPVIEHYRQLGKLVEIPAEGRPDEIFKDIRSKLNI